MVFTTILLLTVVIFASMDLPFHWVFYLTVIGQFFLIVMVYKVLTDNYTTDKTFEDYYEDRPMRQLREGVEN